MRIFLCAVVLALTELRAKSASLKKLSWDRSVDPVSGYRIYYGQSSGNYSTVVDVGDVSEYPVDFLAGAYFAVVTAYDAQGIESLPSNEVSFFTEPAGMAFFYDVNTNTSTIRVVLDAGYFAFVEYRESDLWNSLLYVESNAEILDHPLTNCRFYRLRYGPKP